MRALPNRRSIWRVLILYPLAALIGYWFATQVLRSPRTGGLRPGAPAPAITAPGWLNGDPPAPEELKGKVVVLDAWFAACPACAREAPAIVKAYERFRNQGVVFLGLTPDEPDNLESSRAFLKRAGITWPNGYDASRTLEQYLTDGGYFPAQWVIGRDGKITWNRDSGGTLEEAIAEALER